MQGCGASGGTVTCTVDYTPPTNTSAKYYAVDVDCGGTKDSIHLLPSETEVEIRIFNDFTCE